MPAYARVRLGMGGAEPVAWRQESVSRFKDPGNPSIGIRL